MHGGVMKKYTLGFVFDGYTNNVLLIRKSKDDWQKDRLNGLGGSMEDGETSRQCVSREVFEEANVWIDPTEWVEVGALEGPDWLVYVFTVLSLNTNNLISNSPNEGEVDWYNSVVLPIEVINNLKWLVPLCRDRLRRKDLGLVTVKYNNSL